MGYEQSAFSLTVPSAKRINREFGTHSSDIGIYSSEIGIYSSEIWIYSSEI